MKRLSVTAAGLGASGLLAIDEAAGSGSGSLGGEDGLLSKLSSFSHVQLPPECVQKVKTLNDKGTRITVARFWFPHRHQNLFL